MWSKGTKQSGIHPLHLLSYSVYWLLKHFYQPPYFPSCILFSCTQYWLLWDITHACSLYCCISIDYSVTKKPADKPQTVQTSIYPVIFYSDSVGLFFLSPPPAPSQCSISSTAIITFAVGFARYQTLSLTKSCSEKVSYENSSFPWKLDMHSVTSVFMRISRQSYKQISTSGSKNFWYQTFLLHDKGWENNTVLTWYHFNRRYECFAFMVVCYCLDW